MKLKSLDTWRKNRFVKKLSATLKQLHALKRPTNQQEKKMKRETNKKASNTNRKIHSEHSIWNTTNVISVYPQLRSMHTEHQQICNERTMERERDSSNCMCVAFSSLHSFRFICFVFFVPVFHLFFILDSVSIFFLFVCSHTKPKYFLRCLSFCFTRNPQIN